MPVDIIPFEALGRFENNWLDTLYHFSFADYHDPNRMGVGPLRVWNDDRIAPGMGFDPHPHRNMEIITYVRRGAICIQAGRRAAVIGVERVSSADGTDSLRIG